MQPNQLDPQALNLAKAIRRAETGTSSDPYNTRGASGEYGAYQYMPETWKQWSGQYLQDPNAEYTVENQNKVAYSRIKELKDQGYNPAQIASMWNSGSPTAYQEGKRGTNSMGVDYDVPGYVEKVSRYYNEAKMGGQAAPIGPTQFQTSVTQPETSSVLSQLRTPTAQLPEEQSQLDYRLNQGSEALSKLSQGISSGNVADIGSGALQTAGAVAGGVLDLADYGLNLATFGAYDATMDFVGKKVIAPLFQAAGGDKVMAEWQEFAQKHPDAAKNIGALGNVVSAIPVFKAVKMGVGAAGDAFAAGVARTGFTKTVEEAAKQELKSSLGLTIKGKKVSATANVKGKDIDPIDTIIEKDYLPDVKEDANGIPRYSTEEAIKKLETNVDLDDELLDQRLQEAMSRPLPAPVVAPGRTMAQDAIRSGYYPVVEMRKDMAEVIREQFKAEGTVAAALKKMENLLDDYESSYGQYVPLTTLREIKSGVRSGVKYGSEVDQALDKEVRKQMGRVFMEKIETMAKERDLKDVAEISGRMQADLEALDVLKFLDQRSVVERPGWRTLVGRRSGDMATIAGESIGQSILGAPGIGAAAGRAISNRAISGTGKSVVSKLRAKRGRKMPSKGLVGAALAPSLLSSTQEGLEEQQ